MFGDNNDQQQDANVVEPTPDAALAHDGGGNVGAPAVPDPAMSPPPVSDTAAGNFMMDDMPGAQPAPAPPVDSANPGPAPAPAPSASATTVDADELLSIKQQALTQLTPLVGHLDQDPEEKFRTTMMMIQASDNDALIKTAYEAAQAIPDDKARAQALLDIVNEINYFTQNGNTSAAA